MNIFMPTLELCVNLVREGQIGRDSVKEYMCMYKFYVA